MGSIRVVGQMCIICTRKLRIICTLNTFVSYVRHFQYHKLSVFFGMLFICIFMIAHHCTNYLSYFTNYLKSNLIK